VVKAATERALVDRVWRLAWALEQHNAIKAATRAGTPLPEAEQPV
jgi:hypothetical protein